MVESYGGTDTVIDIAVDITIDITEVTVELAPAATVHHA